MIKLNRTPVLYSPVGLTLVLVNYIVTVALTALIIMALNKNRILRFVLTGK